MPWVPFQRLELQSPKPVDRVLADLRAATRPRSWWPFGKPALPLEGEVIGAGFDLRRVINFGNSWRPRVRGFVEATSHGSTVRVVLSLEPFVLGFMVLYLGGGLLISAGMAVQVLTQSPPTPPVAALAALMLPAGGYLMMMGWYTFEARRTLRTLAAVCTAPN